MKTLLALTAVLALGATAANAQSYTDNSPPPAPTTQATDTYAQQTQQYAQPQYQAPVQQYAAQQPVPSYQTQQTYTAPEQPQQVQQPQYTQQPQYNQQAAAPTTQYNAQPPAPQYAPNQGTQPPAPNQRSGYRTARYYGGNQGSSWSLGGLRHGFEGTWGGCHYSGFAGPGGYKLNKAC